MLSMFCVGLVVSVLFRVVMKVLKLGECRLSIRFGLV